MNRSFFGIALCVASFVSAPAIVSAAAAEGAMQATPTTSVESFRLQAEDVRKDMQPGGRYAGTSAGDQQIVSRRLDEMQRLLEQRNGDSLGERERMALFNAQEEINAILTRNDGERLICEYKTVSGSHRREKVCYKAATADERRRQAQDELARKNLLQRPPASGGN